MCACSSTSPTCRNERKMSSKMSQKLNTSQNAAILSWNTLQNPSALVT